MTVEVQMGPVCRVDVPFGNQAQGEALPWPFRRGHPAGDREPRSTTLRNS
jgi:hypothetical protein